LQAIRDHIPVKNLILVDGGSADDTVSLARSYGAKIVTERGLLGRVRYVQAQECSTDWIAYVDSDVYVYEQWWREVSKNLDTPEVGMVLGFADAELDKLPEYDAFLKYKAGKFGAEAFSNTAVRRRLVLECESELENVAAGEDSVVARHIVASGYKIVTIPKRLCFHDRKMIETHPCAYFRSGQSIRQSNGVLGLYRMANSLRTSLRDWWAFSKDTRTFRFTLLAYLGNLWLWMLVGFLSDPRAMRSREAGSN
jgi:glycosyltransferase involved in cell wall biosynthesis